MTQRYAQIDQIKIFAVFSVVAVHFLLNSGFYDIKTGSLATSIGILCRLIFITAVPLFMMTTGFLMGEKTLDAHYMARLLQFIVVYIVIALIDWAGQCLLLHQGGTLTDALWGLMAFSTDDYAWYVEMYIGLYLMIPFLNAAWHFNRKKAYHVYILGVAMILFFAPSPFNVERQLLPAWWTGAYPIGYYYLGLYFKTYQEALQQTKWRTWFISFVLIFGWFATTSLIANYHRVFAWTAENDYMGYQPMMLAVLIFAMWLKVPIQPQKPTGHSQKLSIWLANMTLSIYLMSHLTDRVIYTHLKQLVPNVADRLPWAPVVILASFLSATFLAGITTWLVINPIFNQRKGQKK